MSEFRADDATPTARALVALELIQDRPGVSGERLGERLGVTSRAARRYVGILRQAGIPVESTPGKYGGYRLGRGFRVPPLMFSTDEALALVMAAVRGRAGVGGDGAVDSALDKIVRVLPASLVSSVEALRGIGSAPVGEGPDPRLVSTLARAAQDGVRLRLAYRTARGSELREMTVDPWGVNLRHDRWYLLCWSHHVDAKRVLRLDRVESATPTGDRFDPPTDLDVVATVDEHMSEGWGIPVEVVVHAPLDDVAACLPRSLGRLEATSAGGTRVVGSTDDAGWYAWQLLRVDAPFTVVGPPALGEECRRLSRRLHDAAPG
jgi:predicted DNA-binding transcriptional regulator YafY